MILRWLIPNPLTWKLRKQFYERASSQMPQGISLERALVRFRDALMRRKKHRAARAIDTVSMRVKNGDTLVTAFGPTLTDLERTVLEAGARSGSIVESMQLVLNVRSMIDRIFWKLVAGFLPSFVYLFALYKVLQFIGSDVVPGFASTLPADKWTGWAKVLYLMGYFATSWAMPVAVLCLLVFSLWCVWALPNWTGRGRSFFDRWVFPFPLYREITGFAWFLSFLALQRAKIPEVDALSKQIHTGSAWLASRLEAIQDEVRNGFDLAAAMERTGQGFPSVDLIDDIGEYGGFEDSTEKLATAAHAHAHTLERKVLMIGGGLALSLSLLVYAAMFVMQFASNSLSSALTSTMRHM